MKKKRSVEEDFIISYLNKLKLAPVRNITQFWNELHYKYDKDIVEKLNNIVNLRADGIISNDLYEVKNQNLDLSLNFSRYSTDLYRKYFEWFIKINSKAPDKILDIGCDNGIIACFYALLFPECSVFGIDISENGIKCAEQLKKRLSLNNVKFKVANIQDISKTFVDYKFSLVTSIRTLHEAVKLPEVPEHMWSMQDLNNKEFEDNDLTKLLANIREMLTPDGKFITWERMSKEENLLYLKELKKAGLFFDSKLSKLIQFHEVGDEQSMAVLVMDTEHNDKDLVKEVLHLHAGGEIESVSINDSFEGISAELCFNECSGKTFLTGFEVDYVEEKGNKMRNELWKFDCAVLFYQYSNIGYRLLNVYHENLYNDLVERFKQIKIESTKMGNAIKSYNSLDERALLQ